MSPAAGPAQAAEDAIARGVAALADLGIDGAAYRLVQARSEVLSGEADPFRWRLDFKSVATIPSRRGGKVGKGGELSLTVDLETGEVTRRRGGD